MKCWVFEGDFVPREAKSFEEFTDFVASPRRQVVWTAVGNYSVSTVFVVSTFFDDYDHPNYFFETLVFGLDRDREIRQRYLTVDEARAGHDLIVETLKCEL